MKPGKYLAYAPEEKYAQAVGWSATAVITAGAGVAVAELTGIISQARQKQAIETAQENIATLQRVAAEAPSDIFVLPHTEPNGKITAQQLSYKKMIAEQQHILEDARGPKEMQLAAGTTGILTACTFALCLIAKSHMRRSLLQTGHTLARRFSPKSYWNTIRPGD